MANNHKRQKQLNLINDIASLIGQAPGEGVAAVDGDLKPGLGMEEDADWLRSHTKELLHGQFTLLVAGDFNNGKSTFINALMERELLPVGSIATTALIARLISGETLQAKLVFRNGNEQFLDWDTFTSEYRLNSEVGPGENSLVKDAHFNSIDRIDITIPATFLAPGVELVDTPGLGEHESRTRLVLEYMPRAHATIVLLDAKQPLKRNEREFIQLLGRPPFRNVFFVVNRMDLINEKDQDAVRAYLRQRLLPYFKPEGGQVDETLFNSRVFFISALEVHNNKISGKKIYNSSHTAEMVSLKRELLSFLDIESRLEASLHAMLQPLTDIRFRAGQQVQFRRDVLMQPLESLRKKQKQFKEQVVKLRQSSNRISNRLANLGEDVKQLVFTDLLKCIEEMRRSWPHDVEQLDLSELQNLNVLAVQFNSNDKARLEKALASEMSRYLEVKLVQWAQRISRVVGPGIEALAKDVQRELVAFNIEMGELLQAFTSGGSANAALPRQLSASLPTDMISQVLQKESFSQGLMASVSRSVMGELNNVMKNSDMLQTLSYSALSALLGLGQAIFGRTPVGFLAISLGSNLVHTLRMRHEQRQYMRAMQKEMRADRAYGDMGQKEVSQFQKAVRESLVHDLNTRLFDALKDQVMGQREAIYAQIEKDFRVMGENVREQLGQVIEKTVQGQEQLIRQKQAGEQEAHQEVQWLEQALALVSQRFDEFCLLSYGRTLSEEEIANTGEARMEYLKAYVQLEEDTEAKVEAEEAEEPDDEITEDMQEIGEDPEDARILEEKVTRSIQSAIRKALGLPMEAELVLSKEDARLPSVKLARLIGLKPVKDKVIQLMELQAENARRQQEGLGGGSQPSLHLVFTGNPGTGKTTVAEIIGDMYQEIGLLQRGHVVSVSRKDLVGEWVGHTARTTRDVIRRALDGVLFIDEAYSLVHKDALRDFGPEAVAELIQAMEQYRDRLVVIVAGYPGPMEEFLRSNPGLKGRFPKSNHIHFPDYSQEELFRILAKMLENEAMACSDAAKEAIKDVIEGICIDASRNETFSNAREMRSLAESLIARRASRVVRQRLPATELIQPEDIEEQYIQYRRADSVVRTMEEIFESMDRMIGLSPVKKMARGLAKRMQFQKETSLAVEADTLHFIFLGNPGTGKTTVAEMFGKMLAALGYLRRGHLVSVSAGDLIAGYVRQTAGKTRKVVDGAMDGVLFIDEAYDLHSRAEGDFGQQAIAELLRLMEAYRNRIVVILAGYPGEMQAFLDSNSGLASRFRQPVVFPDYHTDELMAIFELMAEQKGLSLSPEVRGPIKKYLENLRMRDRHKFGNARAARLLLDEMLDLHASRIMSIDDEKERKQRSGILKPADVPEVKGSSGGQNTWL